MAQRQFRSDDTDKWNEAFGTGQAGDQTNPTLVNASATTGTAGQYTCTNQWNWNFGDGYLCIIHQTYGSGAGNWEVNKVLSANGAGSMTLKYPLMRTYGAGAQVILITQSKNLSITGTQSPPAWNGSYGGIAAYFASETATISGTISCNGLGYRGGPKDGGGNMVGYCGEDTDSGWARQTSANGISGGGGNENGASDAKPGGGGGGHATAGTNGVSNESPGVYGAGGGTIGVASLTTIYFGGAGGQGAYWYTTGATENPGEGGGITFIFARNIVITGSINVGGSAGASSAGAGGACGGGAGGSVLLKCETATLGTNLIVAPGGSGGTGDSNNGAGGNGGVGRIHMDYSKSYTGSTNPSINVTLDPTVKSKSSGGNPIFFQGGGLALS
jgi:hypothetical protein